MAVNPERFQVGKPGKYGDIFDTWQDNHNRTQAVHPLEYADILNFRVRLAPHHQFLQLRHPVKEIQIRKLWRYHKVQVF